ncbi:MAG: response regulator transcription factor [Synergistaceae bacterium]|jgi:DNA-binding response OmpR family regulator|nr:response regulator transcription factor [Synergistaceae bacterium]
MKTLLVVEDELDILKNHRDFLEKHGYAVLPAENLAHAHEHLSSFTPDAIVLDIMLPDGNGLEFLTELRAAGNKIPVIMLTAWGEPRDVSNGLRLGANDYLSKPFEYEVLLARVEAMFRNVETVPGVITKGPLTLKARTARANIRGEDMRLKPKEFALLLELAENEGRVVSAERLYETVWETPMAGDNRTLKKHISALRKRLEDEGSGYTISSVYGEGYKFEREQRRIAEI